MGVNFRPFETTVAGVSYKNKGGTNRQSILKRLSPGQGLILKREPRNRYDNNAVKVLTGGRKQIGYIPKLDAKRVAAVMDSGTTVKCSVVKVTGGTKSKPTLGCVVRVSADTSGGGRGKTKSTPMPQGCLRTW